MARFDIARLRKENGMSQGELASLLQINQSFLSAIENGKSPLPMEKEGRLCEIFNIKNLNDYAIGIDKEAENRSVNDMTDSDLFNQLLSRFHKQAHSSESEHHHHDHHERIEELQFQVNRLFDRNELLMQRNDRLAEENDRLRSEIDSYRQTIEDLRSEIFKLKS